MRFRSMLAEVLESRLALSAVSFIEHGPVQLAGGGSKMVVGDLNTDGRVDVVVIQQESVAWLEQMVNEQGEARFESRSIAELDAQAVHLADLDGDDDLDLIVTEAPAFQEPFGAIGDVVWFENLDGHGDLSTSKLIGTSEWFWLGTLESADMNADGNVDVLLGTGGGLGGGNISWYANDGARSFSDANPVASFETIVNLKADDLDNDGDQDVFVQYGSDFNWTLLTWYKNGGDGTTFERQDIHESFSFPAGGQLVDLDGDGDQDVVSGQTFPDTTIGWNENRDGNAADFSEREVLIPFGDSLFATFSSAADIDGDGDADLLAIVGDELVWYENEKLTFDTSHSLGKRSAWQVELVDVDADDDLDVVTIGRDGFSWLENRGSVSLVGDLNGDGSVGFADFLILSANFGRTDAAMADGDLDGDGRVAFADFLLLAFNYQVLDGE